MGAEPTSGSDRLGSALFSHYLRRAEGLSLAIPTTEQDAGPGDSETAGEASGVNPVPLMADACVRAGGRDHIAASHWLSQSLAARWSPKARRWYADDAGGSQTVLRERARANIRSGGERRKCEVGVLA